MSEKSISRRDFLKTSAIVAGSLAVPAVTWKYGDTIRDAAHEALFGEEPSKTVENMLKDGKPVKIVNGSIIQETKEGTRVISDPIFLGTVGGDTATGGSRFEGHFFAASHVNGKPKVKEYKFTPYEWANSVSLNGPSGPSAGEPEVFEAVLKPVTPDMLYSDPTYSEPQEDATHYTIDHIVGNGPTLPKGLSFVATETLIVSGK